MSTVDVVRAWRRDTTATLAVRVAPGVDDLRAVEYIGQTSTLRPDGTPKTPAEIRTDLIAAVKAVRDARPIADVPITMPATVDI